MRRPAKHRYVGIITETLRYAVTINAASDADAIKQTEDLWHEQMQLFRCISDGGIEAVHVEKIGGDK